MKKANVFRAFGRGFAAEKAPDPDRSAVGLEKERGTAGSMQPFAAMCVGYRMEDRRAREAMPLREIRRSPIPTTGVKNEAGA
jgi:hypothetical protein